MRARQGVGRRGADPILGLWRALGLTVASALIWGVAHLWAGRRAAGLTLMGMFVGLVGGLAILGVGFRGELQQIAVQRIWLDGITIAILGLAIVWTAVVARSYVILRPDGLPTSIRVAAGSLVVVLTVLLCTPLVYAANATYVLRGTLGAIFHGDGHGPKIDTANPWKNRPRLNVLLLGGDGGKDRTGIRPDSMTVVSVDTHTGNAVLFGLPRSLQKFPMPARLKSRWPDGYTGTQPGDQGLLNEIYQAGEANPDLVPGYAKGERGPELTEEVIGNLLGLRIDYYVLVNLDGFKDIVDAIGGVTVHVPKRLPIGGDDDPNHLRPPTGYLEPGRQKLDGEKALWFARSRHADDDYHRMDRQKCLLKDIAEQADPQKVLTRFEKLANAARSTVSTNIPAELLPALVELSGSVKKGANLYNMAYNPYQLAGFHVYQPNIQIMRHAAEKAIVDSQTGATAKPTPAATKKRVTATTAQSTTGSATPLKNTCA